GDRRVVPPGQHAGEDLGDVLPGQAQVSDPPGTDVQVVHEGRTARGVRHVDVSAVRRRVVARTVLDAIRDVRRRPVHGALLEAGPADGGAGGGVVDMHAVLLDVAGPVEDRVVRPA